ncbi:MAG: IS3 family transposase, partial [Candidatus Kapaibacterium sp.]
KKNSCDDPAQRRQLIDADHPALSIRRQCALLGIHRSGYYHRAQPACSAEDLELMRLIDAEYTRHPFYGSRRMRHHLAGCGHTVNRKHIRRLMRVMGIEAIYPRRRTSQPDATHRRYPYLLSGYQVSRANEVWSADITYIPIDRGFMYLFAVIDWYSRLVIAHTLSTTMDVGFCLDGLELALSTATPMIFNTDQGSQFTSREFTDRLHAGGIQISMDGRGRCFDNIFIERLWRSLKYEDIYLREYRDGAALRRGIAEYFRFYNHERPHQALKNQTPMQVHLASEPI